MDLVPPSIEMEHEINVTIEEGETVTFVCKVGGNPEPRMVFFKDDKRLRSNENVTIGMYRRRNLECIFFWKCVGPNFFWFVPRQFFFSKNRAWPGQNGLFFLLDTGQNGPKKLLSEPIWAFKVVAHFSKYSKLYF